ncbi:hypothetical protein GCM10008961_16330 [Deinococcus knuensis]|uniref:Periplasmic binding protein/LacI sugar binding domain-containing protein n=1 Tax=Deinococcus knuensis TaxID=1837380 RepID=A0ABQ2SFC9_9DEIO|nr:hypothetical protein GCM10008961_16330 [Deinococcus knuensis]
MDTPYHPVVNSGHWSRAYETKAIETLIHRGTDAPLLLGSTLSDETLTGVAARVPLILFGRTVPGLEGQCLTLDQRHGAHLATRHLIELGHRATVHLSGPREQQDADERLLGYRQALQDNDIPLRPELEVPGDFVEQPAYRAVTHLLNTNVPSRPCSPRTTRWPPGRDWPCTARACASRTTSRW